VPQQAAVVDVAVAVVLVDVAAVQPQLQQQVDKPPQQELLQVAAVQPQLQQQVDKPRQQELVDVVVPVAAVADVAAVLRSAQERPQV
jgi:hypothetical protein